jgi:hypothetical protein
MNYERISVGTKVKFQYNGEILNGIIKGYTEDYNVKQKEISYGKKSVDVYLSETRKSWDRIWMNDIISINE